MDIYTYPFAQPENASNPIVGQTVMLADNVLTIHYKCADEGIMTWTVNLNDLRSRPDFRNHVCYILAPDSSITNLYEDLVKNGISTQDFFISKTGYVVGINAQDNPKENPIISLVLRTPTNITPELVGDLVLAGSAPNVYYPLGKSNTNP